MIKLLLGSIACAALVYGLMSVPEMILISTDSSATVWQQISARIAIGFSLLIFAVSVGLAAILAAIEKRGRGAAESTDGMITGLVGQQEGDAIGSVPTKLSAADRAESRRQRLARTMGVTLPDDESENTERKVQIS